jgi:acylphosphatase
VLVARRIVLTGRVQGVGFRLFAEQAARVEGLQGWVTNLPDGRIEAVAEGERESVDRFELKMRRGPARAQVDAVHVEDLPPSRRPTGFSVR